MIFFYFMLIILGRYVNPGRPMFTGGRGPGPQHMAVPKPVNLPSLRRENAAHDYGVLGNGSVNVWGGPTHGRWHSSKPEGISSTSSSSQEPVPAWSWRSKFPPNEADPSIASSPSPLLPPPQPPLPSQQQQAPLSPSKDQEISQPPIKKREPPSKPTTLTVKPEDLKKETLMKSTDELWALENEEMDFESLPLIGIGAHMKYEESSKLVEFSSSVRREEEEVSLKEMKLTIPMEEKEEESTTKLVVDQEVVPEENLRNATITTSSIDDTHQFYHRVDNQKEVSSTKKAAAFTTTWRNEVTPPQASTTASTIVEKQREIMQESLQRARQRREEEERCRLEEQKANALTKLRELEERMGKSQQTVAATTTVPSVAGQVMGSSGRQTDIKVEMLQPTVTRPPHRKIEILQRMTPREPVATTKIEESGSPMVVMEQLESSSDITQISSTMRRVRLPVETVVNIPEKLEHPQVEPVHLVDSSMSNTEEHITTRPSVVSNISRIVETRKSDTQAMVSAIPMTSSLDVQPQLRPMKKGRRREVTTDGTSTLTTELSEKLSVQAQPLTAITTSQMTQPTLPTIITTTKPAPTSVVSSITAPDTTIPSSVSRKKKAKKAKEDDKKPEVFKKEVTSSNAPIGLTELNTKGIEPIITESPHPVPQRPPVDSVESTSNEEGTQAVPKKYRKQYHIVSDENLPLFHISLKDLSSIRTVLKNDGHNAAPSVVSLRVSQQTTTHPKNPLLPRVTKLESSSVSSKGKPFEHDRPTSVVDDVTSKPSSKTLVESKAKLDKHHLTKTAAAHLRPHSVQITTSPSKTIIQSSVLPSLPPSHVTSISQNEQSFTTSTIPIKSSVGSRMVVDTSLPSPSISKTPSSSSSSSPTLPIISSDGQTMKSSSRNRVSYHHRKLVKSSSSMPPKAVESTRRAITTITTTNAITKATMAE